MTHKWDKKYHVTFWLLLASGIGLCIGGIWLAPLLIPGGVCLAGAFGMYASAYVRMYAWKEDDMNPPAQEASHPDEVNIQQSIQINVLDRHVEFHPHYDMISRPRNPSLEEREMHYSKSAPQLTLV